MKSFVSALLVLFSFQLSAATVEFTSGSTTDVRAIRGVEVNGEIYDVEFFTSTFASEYGTTPPYSNSEASAIQSLITSIFNGNSNQSPFPQRAFNESSLVGSVLGETEFHVADFYRFINPGTGRPDWGSKAGILGTGGFNQVFWGNATTGGKELDDIYVFAELVPPVSNVPVPAALWLLGSALFGLTAYRKS